MIKPGSEKYLKDGFLLSRKVFTRQYSFWIKTFRIGDFCLNNNLPLQDVVTRWAHQNGHFVERRFGWDTHGLPVEFEVDKTLGITGPADILAMGIDKYNDECRKIVMRYSKVCDF